MSRKNIFELLEEKYNVQEEIEKISNLFNSKTIRTNNYSVEYKTYDASLEEIVDGGMLYLWKARNGCISCDELRRKLRITGTPTDLDEILKYLEYYLNIITLVYYNTRMWGGQHSAAYYMLEENINTLLDHLNYEKLELNDEQRVLLVPKNPAATAVAEMTENKNIAFALLKYNHASLKGQLEEKKQLIVSIANEYEPLLKNPTAGFKEYFDKVNAMLNNMHLRHNNKSGSHKNGLVAQMSDEDLEKWYDETYQLLLFCVLSKDNAKRKDEMAELLKELKKEK